MAERGIRQLLEDHPFFSGLDAHTLEFVAGCGHNVHFDAGEYIFREGEPADRLYVLRSGRVALELAAADRDLLIVDTLGPDEVLGVSWLVPPHRWSFDGRALEPTSAISLDATCLRAKCVDDPQLGFALMQRLATVVYARLRSARLRLADVYGRPKGG